MAWYEITEAEIAPRQPLDSELFNKIRTNLNIGLGSLGVPYVVPNGSFEFSTSGIPSLWTVTSYATATGGDASVSTVSAHGGYSLKLTKASSHSKIDVFTDDYIAIKGATTLNVKAIIWPDSTGVKCGIGLRCYTRDYTTTTSATIADNSISNRATVPTTYTVTCTISSMTRFVKVGCICSTDATVSGVAYFDNIYISTA